MVLVIRKHTSFYCEQSSLYEISCYNFLGYMEQNLQLYFSLYPPGENGDYTIYMVLRILVLDYSELSLLLAFFAAGLLMHGGCHQRQAAEPILLHHKFPASHIFDRRQVCSLQM